MRASSRAVSRRAATCADVSPAAATTEAENAWGLPFLFPSPPVWFSGHAPLVSSGCKFSVTVTVNWSPAAIWPADGSLPTVSSTTLDYLPTRKGQKGVREWAFSPPYPASEYPPRPKAPKGPRGGEKMTNQKFENKSFRKRLFWRFQPKWVCSLNSACNFEYFRWVKPHLWWNLTYFMTCSTFFGIPRKCMHQQMHYYHASSLEKPYFYDFCVVWMLAVFCVARV